MKAGVFSAFALLLMLAACDKTTTREETATLAPTRIQFWRNQEYSYPANDTAWPCPADTTGLGSAESPPGFLPVGYEHSYDTGTRPFNCSRRLVNTFRTAVRFDLSALQSKAPRLFVKSAVLTFRRVRAAGDHDCADQLLTATEDWTVPGFDRFPKAEARYDGAVPKLGSAACGLGGTCQMDVKGAVSDWALGNTPNHGFVIVGENEDSGARDNKTCRTEYGDFQLTTNFTYDQTLIFPTEPSGKK